MTTRTITQEALAAALDAEVPAFLDVTLGSTVRDELAAAIFAALPAEPAGTGLGEALEHAKQHRECGRPTFDGCYSHFTGPHCRADGLPWPCDVESIRAALAATPVGEGEG